MTVSGSSHEPKKLGPNVSYGRFANSCVLRDLRISLLRFFTDYPVYIIQKMITSKLVKRGGFKMNFLAL